MHRRSNEGGSPIEAGSPRAKLHRTSSGPSYSVISSPSRTALPPHTALRPRTLCETRMSRPRWFFVGVAVSGWIANPHVLERSELSTVQGSTFVELVLFVHRTEGAFRRGTTDKGNACYSSPFEYECAWRRCEKTVGNHHYWSSRCGPGRLWWWRQR